ncbi:threonine synthase [Halorubrum sp. DTA98]|uniref:threonine synthase n=1 Tax=Halorubrum sp. DTA98 TaxID=3402163 RepID=UPI003AAEE0B8
MTTLTCYACGESVSVPSEPASPRSLPGPRCDCGEPRWFEADPGRLAELSWPDDLDDRMWAFADLLPVEPPRSGVATAPGGTPLVRTPALDDYAGTSVSVKVEGENPTGSFKDRGSAVGVALAAAAGADAVGTVSHGNMAISTAAVAAAFGLDCVVCVPANIPEERLGNIARFGPRIVRVEGEYGRLYHEALAIGSERGVPFVNSDTPGRVAGQKTTVLEALAGYRARNDGDLPDAVVLPVSSGGHASGAYKGIRELRDAGLIDGEGPRLYLVQAAACAPIARADERGLDRVEPVERGETIAYSIANPDPPSGTRALYGARETGGGAIAVDDDDIREAQRRLAVDAGLAVETASATSLAGVRRLVDRGSIDPGEDVICVATGSGFKESIDGRDVDADVVALSDLGDAI